MQNEFWSKEEVVANLWNEYKNSKSYKDLNFTPQAIAKNHQIVINREQRGLRSVLGVLQSALANKKRVYRDELVKRKPADWLHEWNSFHNLLFKEVLNRRGFLRKSSVRFGSPSDEEFYDVPDVEKLRPKLMAFADDLCFLINREHNTFEETLEFIAKIHHKFICIHPFADGNGRIGRVIIDQLCLAFDMPMVMGSYPRADKKQRDAYHQSIRGASVANDYSLLRSWLRTRIEMQL